MPTGFQVLNDDGVYQITSDYRNLHMVAKGTATLSGPTYKDGGDRATYTATIVRTGTEMPFLAIRSANLVGYTEYTVSGTTTYTLYSLSSGTVDWWFFDLIDPVSTSFGLQVFKADGSLAYDSGANGLRLAGLTVLPGSFSFPSDVSQTYPSGRIYAAIFSQAGLITDFYEHTSSPVVYRIQEVIAMCRWDGVTLIGRRAMTSAETIISSNYSDDMPTNQYLQRPPTFLVADVTNF